MEAGEQAVKESFAWLGQWSRDEMQAVALATLCVLGAWVIISWLIHLLLTLLWPCCAFGIVMCAMPSWRQMIVQEVVPRNIGTLKRLFQRLLTSVCEVYHTIVENNAQ